MLTAIQELDRLLERSAEAFTIAVINTASGMQKGQAAYEAALNELADVIGHTMQLADLKGRHRLLMEADAVRKNRRARFSDVPDSTPIVPGVPFEEAIDRIVEAEPRLAESMEEVSRIYSRERVFALARSANMEITKRVQKEVGELMRAGKSWGEVENAILDIGKSAEMGDVRNWTRAYAQTVYATNANTAYTTGRFEQAMDPDVREVIPAFIRVAQLDTETRPNHAAAHGIIAAVDSPVWHRLSTPAGYNCFPAGAVIEGLFDTAYRAYYRGELVEIRTESGRVLTVTPNHPVLTFGGFCAAKALENGQQTLCHTKSFDAPLSQINGDEMPAVIEDIFKMFAKRGQVNTLRVSPKDFHNDAQFFNGDVDIVRSDVFLQERRESEGGKDFGDLVFPSAGAPRPYIPRAGNRQLCRVTALPSSSSFPRSAALSFYERSVISSSLVIEPFETLRFGTAAQFDASVYEPLPNGGPADAQLSGKLLQRYPGLVSLDRVAKIRHYDFDGHVYDLQSPYGWIVANGIFTSNCRCSTNFISVFELENRGLIDKNGRVKEPVIPAGAYNDKGFTSRTLNFASMV